jgi:hypothetical protein
MWILPKQLHTSAFVPDTEALISDLNEQSQVCAQSLLVRSKVSPARTWSLKWKRDSWTQLLSGRILKPSHGPSFTAAWTSSLAATRASHSAQPASDSEPKTQDTSGPTSEQELTLFDLESVSSRTSKDTLPSGCVTCCKTWAEWVTERRGAWRQRVNAVRLTSGSGSSSWPTIRASEYKDVGPVGSKSHDHMLGKHYLCAVVTQDAANWPTIRVAAERASRTSMTKQGHWSAPSIAQAVELAEGILPREFKNAEELTPQAKRIFDAAQLHGQAAPASSNTSGSRQGLWQTPKATNADCPVIHNPQRSDGGQPNLAAQMVLEQKKQELWLTPRANEPDSDPNFAARNADRGAHCHGTLSSQAKREQWGTPTARDHKSGRGNEDRQYKELTPMVERQQSGKLNPRWVETLMGLPIGWTMPSCTSPQTIAPTSCDSSAMESCQRPLSELSEFSLAS